MASPFGVFLVLPLLAVFCVFTADASTVLDVVHASGTHYDVGFQIGQQTQPMIHRRLAYSDVTDYIKPFLATAPGQLFMELVMNATFDYSESFVEEMIGLAEGSNSSMEDIFILNALAELQQQTNASLYLPELKVHRPARSIRQHCTDVMSTPNSSVRCWGHNEDGSEGDRNTCFIVNATVFSFDGSVSEKFMAFGYAGTVAGLAYGWNHHGVVFTLNSLGPNIQAVQFPMSQAVGREAYKAKSIDDAITTVARGRGISGYNMNIGSLSESRIVSMEMDSYGKAVSVHETSFTSASGGASLFNPTPPSHFYHTNMYLVLNTPQPYDPSSDGRIAALNAYPVPTTAEDVRVMLGDTTNASYPVYNGNGTVDDPVQTLTTVVYDFANETVWIFDHNPKLTAPAYVWPLRIHW